VTNGVIHAQVSILAQLLRLAACLGKDGTRFILCLGDDLLVSCFTVTTTGLHSLAFEVCCLGLGYCQGLISNFAGGCDPAGYFRFGLPNLIHRRAFSFRHR
jgi:hypothetical protein